MTIRNLLPERPADPDRLAADEAMLRAAMPQTPETRPSPFRQRTRSAGVVLAAVVAVGGAGTATAAALGAFSFGHIAHSANGKHEPVSTQFQFIITPDHGPAGTVVVVNATDCFDPGGQENRASYNDGNVGGLFADKSRVRDVPVITTGYTYTGTFTIPQGAQPTGVFTAQCGANIVSRTFIVTH